MLLFLPLLFIRPLLAEEMTELEETPADNKEEASHIDDRDAGLRLQVIKPYLDIRTGNGDNFPIFHVLEKGESLAVVYRRSDWFFVASLPTQQSNSSEQTKQGWVSLADLEQCLTAEGYKPQFLSGSLENYRERDWELGFMAGDFGGANLLSFVGGYAFTENLSAEVHLNQALGTISDSQLVDIDLVHQPFADLRFSPTLFIGAGWINTSPHSNLVQTKDRKDKSLNMGLGLRYYVSKHLLLRAEYRRYLILTSRETNENLNSWKLGFSVYY